MTADGYIVTLIVPLQCVVYIQDFNIVIVHDMYSHDQELYSHNTCKDKLQQTACNF